MRRVRVAASPVAELLAFGPAGGENVTVVSTRQLYMSPSPVAVALSVLLPVALVTLSPLLWSGLW